MLFSIYFLGSFYLFVLVLCFLLLLLLTWAGNKTGFSFSFFLFNILSCIEQCCFLSFVFGLFIYLFQFYLFFFYYYYFGQGIRQGFLFPSSSFLISFFEWNRQNTLSLQRPIV